VNLLGDISCEYRAKNSPGKRLLTTRR